jgi:DNA-directed RNA polymerase subunit RPC12/RpoP
VIKCIVAHTLEKAKRQGRFLPSGMTYGKLCSQCGKEVILAPSSARILEQVDTSIVCIDCYVPDETHIEVLAPEVGAEHKKWDAEMRRN